MPSERSLRGFSPVGSRAWRGHPRWLRCTPLVFGGLWPAVGGVACVALAYALAVDVSTTFASRRASRVALPLLRYTLPLQLLTIPAAWPLAWIDGLINRLFPPRPEDDPERVTEQVMEQMIEQGEELGSLGEDQAELLRSVLEFTDTVAREVMVPRTAMVAVAIDTPLRDVIQLVVDKGHSRYPVYRDRPDQIEGVLYAKDLFRLMQNGNGPEGRLTDLVRRAVLFSAESQKISHLLRRMQARRVHLAIVLDEFGGTSGIVTLEDIIEEIVGEIRDEHDTEENPVRKIGPGRYIANAQVSVYDLADITGLELPADLGDYESLGGMVMGVAGRVPKPGESVQVGAYRLIVREADDRHVTTVEVHIAGLRTAAG